MGLMDWDLSTLFFALDDILILTGAFLILFVNDVELGATLLAVGIGLFLVTGGAGKS